LAVTDVDHYYQQQTGVCLVLNDTHPVILVLAVKTPNRDFILVGQIGNYVRLFFCKTTHRGNS
jgi:hypothetical protein